MTTRIRVTSHVARDFLQNAAYFSTVPKVVWEYVSNAIDNPGSRGTVTVEVHISRERITISDDGAGMSRSDLQRFFQMHGENMQRRQGRRVRGTFGTGKCAAFGIASKLRIETAQRGRLNIVELDRQDILATSGEAIPVRDVTVDAETAGADGTTVIISGLNTAQLEIPVTIAYVQRHIGRRQQGNQVIINDHVCEFEEPAAQATQEFAAPPEVAQRLGSLTLVIKISPLSMDSENAGVDILSYGNWHDTTLAGVPVTELSRRIFGEVDVPALEDYEGPFPPFDNTRNNTLSPQNPLVVVLFGWLANCIREVLADLEREMAEQRRSFEARQLRAEAEKIERLLNEDFRSLEIELENARRRSPTGADSADLVGAGKLNPDSEHVLPPSEGALSSEWVSSGPEPGDGHRGTNPAGLGEVERPGSGVIPGEGAGARRDPIERPRRASGFRVDYQHLTAAAPRSRYDGEQKLIVINLDHPQVKAASNLGGQTSPAFRQVSYELAFVEYAMALAVERSRRDTSYMGEEALYDIRATVDRISRHIGDLFL